MAEAAMVSLLPGPHGSLASGSAQCILVEQTYRLPGTET
jgi:hypothetical protein